jgi:hypothetical protein
VGPLRFLALAVPTVCATGLLTAGGAAAEPAPSPTPAVPSPAGPLTVIDTDGVYVVGTDVVPGIYTSAGPVEGDTCYWRRVGADGATLANALSSQPQIVQINAEDAAFKTRGCQPWQLNDAAALPGETPPWLIALQLRHQLDVLNGMARASGNGELPPY